MCILYDDHIYVYIVYMHIKPFSLYIILFIYSNVYIYIFVSIYIYKPSKKIEPSHPVEIVINYFSIFWGVAM